MMLRELNITYFISQGCACNGQPFILLALRFKLQDLILVRNINTEISGSREKTRTGPSKSGHNWPLHMLFRAASVV